MNGKKAKQQRRAARERSERMVAAIQAAVPVLLRTSPDGNEVWQVGPVTVVVPAVPLDAPTEMQQAVTVYRMAALTARCPRCEVQVKVTAQGCVYLRHEAQCVANVDRLAELGERHGIDVNRTI